MKCARAVRLFAAVLFLLSLPVASACGQSFPRNDPFAVVRADFDAEITWSVPHTEGGETVYTAGLSVRGGLHTLNFVSPEQMKDVRVTETADGTTVSRGALSLPGTAFASFLSAARLLTETGEIRDCTTSGDAISVSYVVTAADGTRRMRTMSLDAGGLPKTVTEAGGMTVRIVWFEPVR